MKKVLSLIVLIIIFSPSVALASWWNPFTWRFHPKTEETKKVENTVATSSVGVYTPPPSDELLKRIAELEDKLQKAHSQITAPKTETVVPKTETVYTGLSDGQISAKVKPAIVYAETATSSGSGVIIDAQGHILVPAHTVWATDSSGAVVGADDQVSVTLSNGVKKQATLIGIDEAHDIAIIQIPSGSSSYVKVNYDSGVKVGDKTYVVGTPSLNGGSTGGSSFVSGVVTKKSSDVVEINTDNKPFDNGGALVNANGDLIGVPNKSTCKVLEEMKNCLKYTITSNIVRGVLPKVLAGMKLYKNKKYSTPEETLVHERLQWMYGGTNSDSTFEYTINSASGDNSFDYFNNKLSDDVDGKITKLYLFKLKQIATNITSVTESLSSRTHELDVFFSDESASIEELGNYQKKIIYTIQSDNSTKLKEYQAKVNLWSKKKNEYDSYIANPAGVTHNYLLEQGLLIEKELNYLKAERSRILNTFSGEAVNIF